MVVVVVWVVRADGRACRNRARADAEIRASELDGKQPLALRLHLISTILGHRICCLLPALIPFACSLISGRP